MVIGVQVDSDVGGRNPFAEPLLTPGPVEMFNAPGHGAACIGRFGLRFEFPSTKKLPAEADAMEFLGDGDSTPNARFNSRYASAVP